MQPRDCNRQSIKPNDAQRQRPGGFGYDRMDPRASSDAQRAGGMISLSPIWRLTRLAGVRLFACASCSSVIPARMAMAFALSPETTE